jgi:5'-deoxynucleotidase YfbR-like HD superfamily hydrolase
MMLRPEGRRGSLEVHAGDTYIYADQSVIDTKKEREHAALKQLEQEWPDFPDMLNNIKEYEDKTSEEAKFVYALDKIMPMMLIYIGEGYTWQKENITHKRLHQVKRHKVAASKEVNEYYKELHELLKQNSHLFPQS